MQSHGGSLLSTINSNVLAGLDARPASQPGLLAEDDKERVTRDLSAALARSVATISRGTSREGSPVKGRPGEASPRREHAPVRGGGSAKASTVAGGARDDSADAESVNASRHDPEMERSESVVRSLQEQAKRRLNGLERLHAGAESKGSGPTLYNPAAYQVSLRKRLQFAPAGKAPRSTYCCAGPLPLGPDPVQSAPFRLRSMRMHTHCQPRGAALSTKINPPPACRPKSAPKAATKSAGLLLELHSSAKQLQ